MNPPAQRRVAPVVWFRSGGVIALHRSRGRGRVVPIRHRRIRQRQSLVDGTGHGRPHPRTPGYLRSDTSIARSSWRGNHRRPRPPRFDGQPQLISTAVEHAELVVFTRRGAKGETTLAEVVSVNGTKHYDATVGPPKP
jgi:hypothetical protein